MRHPSWEQPTVQFRADICTTQCREESAVYSREQATNLSSTGVACREKGQRSQGHRSQTHAPNSLQSLPSSDRLWPLDAQHKEKHPKRRPLCPHDRLLTSTLAMAPTKYADPVLDQLGRCEADLFQFTLHDKVFEELREWERQRRLGDDDQKYATPAKHVSLPCLSRRMPVSGMDKPITPSTGRDNRAESNK